MDPGAGPVQRLAHDLRLLREKAGKPPYREMADRAGYSTTALSQAAAGDQLPTLAVVRAYAETLGADPDEWETRWREADAESRAPAADERAPYRGLARFEPADSDLFFGREALVSELLHLVPGDQAGPPTCSRCDNSWTPDAASAPVPTTPSVPSTPARAVRHDHPPDAGRRPRTRARHQPPGSTPAVHRRRSPTPGPSRHVTPATPADLVVYRADPLTCPADDLLDLSPALTVIGGDVVHRGL